MGAGCVPGWACKRKKTPHVQKHRDPLCAVGVPCPEADADAPRAALAAELLQPRWALSRMNGITDFLARVLRGVLKLALALAATVFVLSFLLAALVLVLVASLLSLLTGRKPAPVVMFNRMRARSQRFTRGAWSGRPAGDVVDVQATEVPDGPAPAAPAATRPEARTQPLR